MYTFFGCVMQIGLIVYKYSMLMREIEKLFPQSDLETIILFPETEGRGK